MSSPQAVTRHPAMRRYSKGLFFAACAALALAACGQKGPLYLPGDRSEIQTEMPRVPTEPANREERQEADSDSEDQ